MIKGEGTLSLTGASDFYGAVRLEVGTLAIGSGAALGASGNTLAFHGGKLQLTGPATLPQSLALNAPSTIDNGGFNATFTGAVSGSRGLTTTGAGTLTFSNAVELPDALTVQAGAVRFAAASSMVTLGGLGKVIADGPTLTLVKAGAEDGSPTFSGSISGSAQLVVAKGGIAPQTLAGENGYTGGTDVQSGYLIVSGAGTLGSGAVTIHSAGILEARAATALSNFFTVDGLLAGEGVLGPVAVRAGGTLKVVDDSRLTTGDLALADGGTLDIGVLDSIAGPRLSVLGSVALAGNVALSLSLASDPADNTGIMFMLLANDGADAISGSGLLTYNGQLLGEGSAFTVSWGTIDDEGDSFGSGGDGGGASQFTQLMQITYRGGDGNDIVLNAIPEPASAALLLAGVGGILGLRYRRPGVPVSEKPGPKRIF